MVENDEDDTIAFTLRNTFIFRADLSGGLTGEEVITMPHLLVNVSDQLNREQINQLINQNPKGCTWFGFS
jgi:hypothetical protein